MRELKPVSDQLDNTLWKGHTDHGRSIHIEKRHTGAGGWKFFIFVQNKPFGDDKGYTTVETAATAALEADTL